jgi:hypothetical protein
MTNGGAVMETTVDIKKFAKDIEARVRPDIEAAKRRLESASDGVTTYIKENPGKCILGAVAIGYLIAKIARR